jgi:hypothetical protein
VSVVACSGERLAEDKFQKQLPTAGWIVKAYWCTEEEIRQVAGLDSVVFLRLIIFRFFSSAPLYLALLHVLSFQFISHG